MIEPIQVACPLCHASPGFSCSSRENQAARGFHEERKKAAARRKPDARQLSLLDQKSR